MPELPELVSDLGLGGLIPVVFTSGLTGYEKPNPMAFRIALEKARKTEAVWMIGDNLVADYRGARQLGIPSILVRRKADDVDLYGETLWVAAAMLRSES